MRLFTVLVLVAGLVACEGEAGPMGPPGAQGPPGPQGPAGEGIEYRVFQGPITSTLIATESVNTGGIPPGIVCYLSHVAAPSAWLAFGTDPINDIACLVVQTGSTYQGRLGVPAEFVNSGWSLRIVLFWLEP